MDKGIYFVFHMLNNVAPIEKIGWVHVKIMSDKKMPYWGCFIFLCDETVVEFNY